MSTTNELCPIRYMVPGAGGCSNSAARRDMPKRVAITIAGAVSLGSYEAGVLYELLEAIRTWNEAAKSEESRIYVDVITGASAGGMTAAMVAQRLMYDGESLRGEFKNPLYQA